MNLPPCSLRFSASSQSISSTRPFRGFSRQKHSSIQHGHSASSKLFADAAREEAEEANSPRRPTRIHLLENEHKNWDGEESVQDAVLRMLVDKYKPLRSGTIQSAEQKLKRNPPTISAHEHVVVKQLTPSSGSWATEPLLPSLKDHQPWHTQFKAPTHATSSIKQASLPPPISAQSSPKLSAIDDRERRKAREEKKRTEHAGKLARAKESTLDYQFGVKGYRPVGQLNPVGMKGWTNLIEDKIQKARKAGLFKTIQGRGQPLATNTAEINPFIAREEFLMNRIVQRNGAAPPWVEVQGELDTAVQTFREILRQSWIRQAIRVITTSTPTALLHTFTLTDIKAFRDPEWEKREHSYHKLAVEEINALVRKYNGLAPYAVRRPYYIQNVEIERVFEGCAEDIVEELRQRGQSRETLAVDDTLPGSPKTSPELNNGSEDPGQIWGFRKFIQAFIARIHSKMWAK